MTKEKRGNLAGALLFYAVLVLGVIVLNARFEYLNEVNTNQTVEQLSIQH